MRALLPSLLASLAALALATEGVAANAHLEKCRALEGEFDYKGMVAECGLVAADANTSLEDRVEVYRLLGFAHTALGDDDAAREWFVRLLVLDPDHGLPPEVSPRFREVFARAQEHIERVGRVSVTHEPPSIEASLAGGPLTVTFEVTDALSRVSQASLLVDAITDGKPNEPVSAPLTKMPSEKPDTARFEGTLPDPAAASGNPPTDYTLRYRLVLAGTGGAEVSPNPPLPPIALPRKGATASVAATEGEGELLLWGGAALASGLVVAGLLGGGVALYCATGRCSSRQVQPPVGYVNVSVDGAQGVLP